MSDEKQIKPVVVAIIIKRTTDGFLIMTQKRRVRDPAYDWLYDGTWEAMGETLLPKEDVLDAVVRGIREECGMSVNPWSIFGNPNDLMRSPGDANRFAMRGNEWGDRGILHQPFAFVQSIGEPQLWLGPVFLVSVPPSWEPNFEAADGEATKHRWWKPGELLEEMHSHPAGFMGLHAPALRLLAAGLTHQRG